jgi:hypothetical protein
MAIPVKHTTGGSAKALPLFDDVRLVAANPPFRRSIKDVCSIEQTATAS